tara:strand:- start:1689 stop:3299 length:1611 start_codon:yes stop_codon:yes gene_type:complete
MLLITAHWFPSNLVYEPNLMVICFGVLVFIAAIFIMVRWPNSSAMTDGIVWMFLALAPFCYNVIIIIGSGAVKPGGVGPSRHLYIASAGSSLLLSHLICQLHWWLLQHTSVIRARAVFAILLVGIVTSSVVALDWVRALSLYASGRSYIWKGHLALGVQQLEGAIRHKTSILPKAAFLHLTVLSLALGKSQQHLLEKELEKDPDSPLFGMLLGITASLLDKPELRAEGARVTLKILEKSKDPVLLSQAATGYNNLGAHYYTVGELPEAIECYLRAIQISPKYYKPISNLTRALSESGRFEEALRVYGYLLELKHNQDDYYHLPLSLQDQGQSKLAIQAYKEYLLIKPNDVSALNNLGILLSEKGEGEDAVLYLKRSVEIDPEFTDGIHNLAREYQNQGKLTEAIKGFEAYLRFEPNDHIVMNTLGILYSSNNRIREALEIYGKADQIAPGFGEPLFNSGVIYLGQEKYDIAEEKFNQALLKDQTLWQAYQGLAEVFEQRGKWKEAIERYRNILELNPSNQNARERIDELIRKHNTE